MATLGLPVQSVFQATRAASEPLDQTAWYEGSDVYVFDEFRMAVQEHLEPLDSRVSLVHKEHLEQQEAMAPTEATAQLVTSVLLLDLCSITLFHTSG
jgi:hypothetical protein